MTNPIKLPIGLRQNQKKFRNHCALMPGKYGAPLLISGADQLSPFRKNQRKPAGFVVAGTDTVSIIIR
jgi:hypothetical protein